MFKYIAYDIEALQNLKLARSNMQEDSEESMEYITGSAIRGAFIYKYIQKYRLPDINQGIHRKKLFKGGITFLNAYPKYEDERSIPFPKCYFAPKEEIKKFKESNGDLNITLGLDNDDLISGYEKVRVSDFAVTFDDEFTPIKVDKESALHINKQKNIEKNKLFRYESIKKGQVFSGIIKVNEEYVEEVMELLDKSEIYVGGSKGSGYGKCIINQMRVFEKNLEYGMFEEMDFEKHIYVLALSDIIFRSKTGQYKTAIDEELIKDKLGLYKVKLFDSCIETKNITGFNNKWNCRMPQIVGIKAGSVFKYGFDGEIDNKLLYKFIDEGIGERKSEGFGRFVILGSLEKDCLLKRYESNKNFEKDNKRKLVYGNLSDDEKIQIQELLNNIYKNRIKELVYERVVDIDKNIKNRDGLNQSQWGKLKDFFIELSYRRQEEGIEMFNKWKGKVSGNRSTSFDQLKRVKVKDKDMIEFLSETIENSMNEKTHTEYPKDIAVNFENFKAVIDKDFTYRMNIKILEELCRYQIRKGVD